MRVLVASLVAAAGALLIPVVTSADNIFVPSDFGTFQAALDAAADGDIIIVADGTYSGTENKNLDFRGKSLTLRSENGPSLCGIDCEGEGRAFSFSGGGNQMLEGFTVINGYADWGGALFCDAGSAPLIRNCRFIGNRAYLGGAVCGNNESSPIISGCEFSGNTAFLHGGALYSLWASPSIENCTFGGNQAYVGGGGILSFGSSSNILNSLIEGNSSDSYGGGLCANHSIVSLMNCTVSGNGTQANGGGLDCYDSEVSLTNCIIWGNTAWEGGQLALSLESSLHSEYGDIEGGAAAASVEAGSTLTLGEGTLDADPLFVSGPLGNYYLSQAGAGQTAQSPCADAGSDLAAVLGLDAYTTRTDHQGDSAVVDIGHHYALLNQITLFLPAAGASITDPPTFRWMAEGETRNAYAVEIKFRNSPWYSTYKNLGLVIDQTSWTPPESLWSRIPPETALSWRVRSIDIDQNPRDIIQSEETRLLYKQ